jgi:hypothetical protein
MTTLTFHLNLKLALGRLWQSFDVLSEIHCTEKMI